MAHYKVQSDDVLLLVDLQKDFCRGGALAVPDGDAVVPIINKLAGEFRHVVLTQDWHPRGHQSFASSHPGRAAFEETEASYGPQVLWPDHCVQETPGAEFHSGLSIPHAELVLRKGFDALIDSYSAFFENDRQTPTGLGGYLRERRFNRVFVVGLAYDFCVRYTAQDAHKQGFKVVVIEDACRAIDVDGSANETKLSLSSLGISTIFSKALT